MDNNTKLNPRKIAVDLLMEIEENKAYSNIVINNFLKKTNMVLIDRNLMVEIIYGVLENKIYLDYIIRKLSQVRIKKINLKVLTILRISLYQIIFLDKIPEHAAVNEGINLVKKYSYKQAGFANALLRRYLREKEIITLPSVEENPARYLSIKYSHPEWIVEYFVEKKGFDFTEALLKANNKKPKLSARINLLKSTKNQLIDQLESENLVVEESPYVENAIYIKKADHIETLESYKQGLFQIQDLSSILAVDILDPQPGELVLDVCAAPGGKTTYIAEKMNNCGEIIARDVYRHKIGLIDKNAERLGIDIIKTQLHSATQLDLELVNKADRVLVDAPCSGLGIIRRKPELRYYKQREDLEELSKLQYTILETVAKYLKRNGVLVYSTCTITDEENMMVVEKFLENNEIFELVEVNSFLPDDFKTKEDVLKLFPNQHDSDGFFVAKLVKK